MVALRANTLFFRDQQYVVQDGEVVIVDEFTGRLMVGRRWSDGLHQAVEAKEGVKIQHENQTLASITFQNYFRMYELSGMTGTADTEAYEFQEIYGLETVIIPTNKPMVRKDQNDQVFKTNEEKYNAILNDIRDARARPARAGGYDQHREFRAAGRPAAEGQAASTKCSTPSSTRAKPRSSPRPASRATSPSPPTWRAAAPTSCWAAARTSRST